MADIRRKYRCTGHIGDSLAESLLGDHEPEPVHVPPPGEGWLRAARRCFACESSTTSPALPHGRRHFAASRPNFLLGFHLWVSLWNAGGGVVLRRKATVNGLLVAIPARPGAGQPSIFFGGGDRDLASR